MRHLSADPRRDPQGRGVRERQIMPDGSMTPRLDRRGFLKVSTAVGGGLALAVVLPSSLRAASAAEASGFTPNAFIRIDRQGLVTLVLPSAAMGQGIYTAEAMLLAEEREVGLAQVRPAHSPHSDPERKIAGSG